MLKNCQALVLFSLLPLNIVINEVAWMGTVNSANDEWIELRNNTPSLINLNGWTLRAIDGTPKIQLAGMIPADSFYLLERSKDYTGALNNKGEKLELYNNLGEIVDSVDCLSGWLAGDNNTKQTMERKNDGAWQTSQNPGGTPKSQNGILTAEIKNEPVKTAVVPDSSGRNSGWQSLAAVSEPVTKTNSVTFIVLLIATCLSVFSGIIILVLKKKIK